MAIAYSYTRFSTPEQSKGDSRRRQVELAEAYAAQHGLELDDKLRLKDEGVSGYTGANSRKGALSQFLTAIDDGDVAPGSFLLVESFDRLSRQTPWDAIPTIQLIVNGGVTLVTLFDGKSYNQKTMRTDPLALMSTLMVMMRSNEESSTKARRIKAVWESKRATANEKPLTKVVPAWMRMLRGKIVLIEDRASVVRRIVAMSLAGDGQHRIAEALNAESVPVFGSGRYWQRSYISKIINNPALIGTYVPHMTVEDDAGKRSRKPLEPVERYYPPAITEEQWSGLLALAGTKRRAPQVRSKGIQNILAGLARCPKCGGTMTRVMKGPRGGVARLVCVSAKAGAGCQYRSVNLSPSTVRTMRRVRRLLGQEAAEGASGWMSAFLLSKGGVKDGEYDDAWEVKTVDQWAERLGKTLGNRPMDHLELLARAHEVYLGRRYGEFAEAAVSEADSDTREAIYRELWRQAKGREPDALDDGLDDSDY